MKYLITGLLVGYIWLCENHQNFVEIESDLTDISISFERIDEKLDTRFDNIDRRFERIDEKLDTLKTLLDGISERQLQSH